MFLDMTAVSWTGSRWFSLRSKLICIIYAEFLADLACKDLFYLPTTSGTLPLFRMGMLLDFSPSPQVNLRLNCPPPFMMRCNSTAELRSDPLGARSLTSVYFMLANKLSYICLFTRLIPHHFQEYLTLLQWVKLAADWPNWSQPFCNPHRIRINPQIEYLASNSFDLNIWNRFKLEVKQDRLY